MQLPISLGLQSFSGLIGLSHCTAVDPTAGSPGLPVVANEARQSCPSPPANAGYLWLNGMNIAGFEFGQDNGNQGICDLSKAYPPIGGADPNGYGQVQHFYSHSNMNTFRYPVTWQYLIGSTSMPTAFTPINIANFNTYNGLIQQCLALGTNTRCIVDIHQYARFQGKIIGQSGGPSNAAFAAFWKSLASMLKSSPGSDRIMFEVMNEAWNVDMNGWQATLQAAVSAIRSAMGNNNNIILIGGTDWSHSGSFVAQSATYLNGVTNPDGSTTNIIFVVHDYFQGDNASPIAQCTSQLSGPAQSVACWLRQHARQAMFTETGGGKLCVGTCMSSLKWLAQNSDVFIGYTAWAAGSFPSTYIFSEAPDANWNDTPMAQQCFSHGPQYIA